MTSDFPTRLADLSLKDSSHHSSLYANLKSIRQSTLSIPNRLSSILEDTKFAEEVSQYYDFPLVANERCGSWYIDPANKAGSAYFKSTDGHHGQWDFSARRLNLQLLPLLAAHGGAVVVDSTRRGKTLPDALSKSVPIWVATLNRALFPEVASMHHLQSPPAPDELCPSETYQIEARLNKFVTTFTNLGLDLQNLRRQLGEPIRVSWAVNGSFDAADGMVNRHRSGSLPGVPERSCHHLVLCSASRRVRGSEVSEGGYIQGAGDDSEAWSHGLTAQLFWEYKELLMRTSEDELRALINGLVQQEGNSLASSPKVTRILPTSNIYIAAGSVYDIYEYDLIVNCEGSTQGANSRVLHLNCRPGKLGSKDLRGKLPVVISAVSNCLQKHPEGKIMITCATGKDFSVGVTIAILCLLFNDQGQLREETGKPIIEKQLVKQRLAWVTCSQADANPARATLQACNSFLMQPPDQQRQTNLTAQ